MKKIFTLAMAAMLAMQASAQVTEKYEEVGFSKMSPDGKWLVENLQGAMNILDRNTGTKYSCQDADGLVLYMPGLGNCVTNEGAVAGTGGDYAAVWKDGEWTNLPQDSGIGTSFNAANAITPDGHRIVGILGRDGSSLQGNNAMMAFPVVWTKNAKGEYECKKLPCPETDFAGLAPQYITAMYISDDGKTVVGHLRDFTGFYVMPIVYTEGADGEWSYKVIGQKNVYKEDLIDQLPPMPTSPTMPDPAKYMTADDVEKYNAAVEEYNEKVDLFFQGVIDEYPEYPLYENYMSDETQKAAYLAAVAQYQKDQQQFNEDYTAYVAKRDEIVTNMSFAQNVAFLSSDGRYLGVVLEDRSTSDAWGGASDKYVGYFDLAEDKPEFVKVTDGGDYTLTGMTDTRDMFVASPAMENTRSTFVVKAGAGNATLQLPDYIATSSAQAAQWVKDNNTYDVDIYGLDDDYNYIVIDTKKDSLITGTVTCNADGSVMLSYYTDNFSDPETTKKLSYIVDLKSTVGISSAALPGTRKGTQVSVEGRTVKAANADTQLQVYDMNGRLVGSAEGSATLPTRGVYAVRSTDADGNTSSTKVVVE